MMTKQTPPLISIITPVYNADEFLTRTIQSVQDQTHEQWELLLVDDCSSDTSVDTIEKFILNDDRIKLIRMEANSGAALARNAGTKKARGRYVAFLDSDDIWAKTKLEKQVRFMQKHNHAFTFTGYEFAHADGTATGNRVSAPVNVTYTDYLRNNIVWTSTVMIDLQQIERSDLYMPSLSYGEDGLTWLRLLKLHGYAAGLDLPLAYYRRTRGSLSANKLKIAYRKLSLYLSIKDIPAIQRLFFYLAATFNAVVKRV